MLLLTITSSSHSQKVWLKFSSGQLLPLKIDDLYRLHLKKGQEVTPPDLAAIEQLSIGFLIEEYCLRQISISPKVRQILLSKINQYWYRTKLKYQFQLDDITSITTQVLDGLEAKGLLKPEDYADYFQRRHPHYSLSQIKYHLSSLGINLHLVSTDLPKITSFIQKKYSKVNFGDYSSKGKVILALSRRGFAIADIKTAIDEFVKNR